MPDPKPTMADNPMIAAHHGLAVAPAVVVGVVCALLVGAVAGWLRYWVGFFVLAQGAMTSLLVAGLIRLGMEALGLGVPHPGFRLALRLAWIWFLALVAGIALGFGLAQPWFDPLGWLWRVWEEDTSELVFGVAATAGIHRGFALGAQGWFWLVLSLIDWAIMFFFLLAMPWRQVRLPRAPRPRRARRSSPAPAAPAPAPAPAPADAEPADSRPPTPEVP